MITPEPAVVDDDFGEVVEASAAAAGCFLITTEAGWPEVADARVTRRPGRRVPSTAPPTGASVAEDAVDRGGLSCVCAVFGAVAAERA